MPDPVAATAATTTVPSAASLEALVAANGFADQLRAAVPGQTVNLGSMLSALVGGSPGASVASAGTGPVGAGSASVGLGAMTKAAGVGGVAAPTGVGRTLSGDAAKTDQVVRFALAQQGKPYVFGTKGPDTFDCSGLMSAAYKQIGVDIPAYTFTQATYGRAVDPRTEAIKPGDLIFVRGGRPATDLGHVGMAVSATEWVQAPRTGDVVKTGPLPYDRIQVVRRLVGS